MYYPPASLILLFIIPFSYSKYNEYQIIMRGRRSPNSDISFVTSQIDCSEKCAVVQCASFSYSKITKDCDISMQVVGDFLKWNDYPDFTYWEPYVGCPSNFTRISDGKITKCVQFNQGPKPYWNSMDYCRRQGSHLVKVDSEASTQMIIKYISSLNISSSSEGARIGLVRNRTSAFKWFDEEPLIYTNWLDENEDPLHKKSAIINYSSSFKWLASANGELQDFMCEIPLAPFSRPSSVMQL